MEEGVALWWGNVELMAPLVVSTPEPSVGQKESFGIPKEPSPCIVLQVRRESHCGEVLVKSSYAFIVQVV
jgi:hypothetical protein